jgi:hypothetical protein
MKRSLQVAAAGFAVIVAGATVANAFQLEQKGTSAKWRTDIVAKNNKYTACLLAAWSKCEIAATKAGTGSGSIDCDITVKPVPASTSAPSAAIAALNTAITKCDAAVSNPLAKVGFSAAKPVGSNISLNDIGCIGDCGTQDGSQPCADVEAYEVSVTDPLNNALKTAAGIVNPLLVGVCALDDSPPKVPAGTAFNTLALGLIKYTGAITAAAQKCQDDLGTKAGGGFFDDGSACIIPLAPNPLNLANPYQKAVDTAKQALTKAVAKLPTCGSAASGTSGLVDAAINNATAGQYDRVDNGLLALANGVASSASPFFAGASAPAIAAVLADRNPSAANNRRVAFGGVCASCGNGVVEDFEECDGAQNALCGVIPGTIAGACPTADNALTKSAACRCPR